MSSSTIEGTNVLTPELGPNVCLVTIKVVSQHGNPISGAIVTAKIKNKAEFAGQAIVANEIVSDVTDGNGEATLTLIRFAAFSTDSGEYRIHVKYGQEHHHFDYVVPNVDAVVAYLPLA